MANHIFCIQIISLVLVSVMPPPEAMCQDRIAKLLRTPVFEQRLTAAFERKDDGVFRSMLLHLNLSAGGPIPPVKYLTGIDKASLREEALYLLSDNRRLDAIRLRDMCDSTPDDWLKSCFGDPVLSPELLIDSGFIKRDQVDNHELLTVLRVLSTYDQLGNDPQQCRLILGDVNSLWSRIRRVAEDRTLDRAIRIDAITALICLGDVRGDLDSSEKYREIKLLMELRDLGFLVYLRCLELKWSRAAGVVLPLLPDEEFDYYPLFFFSGSPGTEAEFFLDGIDDAATAGSPSFRLPKELATLRSLIKPSDEAATRITNERMVEELGDSILAVRVITSFLKYSLEQKQGSEFQQCLELATAYLEKYQGQLRQDDLVDIELLILRLKGAMEDAGETESLYRRLIEKITTSGGELFVPPDQTSKSVPILIRLAEYPAARDRDIQLIYQYCFELRKSQSPVVAGETYCFWRTLGYLWSVSGRDAELLASVRADPGVANAFCHGVALRIAHSPDEGLDLVHILSNKGLLNDPNNVYSFVLELEMMRLEP